MDAGEGSGAARSTRRRRQRFRSRRDRRGAASRPLAGDDGADPDPTAGHSFGEPMPLGMSLLGEGRRDGDRGPRFPMPVPVFLRDGSFDSETQQDQRSDEMSSSELGGAVTDLQTREVLALSDQPSLTSQITGEETDDDDASCHLYGPDDVGHSIGPMGLTTEMLRSLDDSLLTYVPWEEMQRPDSDDDSEEVRREVNEYFDRLPAESTEEAFARIVALQHARYPFLVDQEPASLQAQQDSAAAAHPQDSLAISHDTSTGVIKDGKQWMRDEVTLCFKEHVKKTPYLAGVVFELDELCHQCFSVENYMKVFHHYNFKMRMKMPASDEWTVELYFGEVKEVFGTKFYFCCPLEPKESGHCNTCKKQGMEDLKHPVTGGFEIGLPDDDTDVDEWDW